MIKHRDEWAGDIDITTVAADSVKSFGDFAEILAAEKPAIWESHKPGGGTSGKMLTSILAEAAKIRRSGARRSGPGGVNQSQVGIEFAQIRAVVALLHADATWSVIILNYSIPCNSAIKYLDEWKQRRRKMGSSRHKSHGRDRRVALGSFHRFGNFNSRRDVQRRSGSKLDCRQRHGAAGPDPTTGPGKPDDDISRSTAREPFIEHDQFPRRQRRCREQQRELAADARRQRRFSAGELRRSGESRHLRDGARRCAWNRV